MAEKRRRDMWANIPWSRRAQIVSRAKRMPDGMHKTILLLAFEDGMSTQEIHDLAKNRPDLYSRNHKPVSKRRVLQIIAEHVPDYNAYQKKGEHKERSDHYKFNWAHRDDKVRCAFCGATNKLEWHHMIPVFLGGTADGPNMVCLCHPCHKAVTAYQKEKFPEAFAAGKGND